VEAFDLGVTIGNESIEAADFLADNQQRFVNIRTELQGAVNAFGQGDVEPMNSFLAFINDFLRLYEEPVGGRLEPAVFVRTKSFTYGFFGQAQALLEEEFDPGSGRVNLLREASELSFPLNQADAQRLAELINAYLNGQGELSTVSGLGVVDLVGVVSTTLPLRAGLHLGLTGKVVNRRVGLRIISVEDFDDPYQRSIEDIQQSATRFGLDAGLLYELPRLPLSLGLAVTDLIATEGNVNPNEDGITFNTVEELEAELARNGYTSFLIEDASPTIVTLGASYAFTPRLHANLDVIDLADRAPIYEGADHIRAGVEYGVLSWLRLRGGVGAGHLTGGAGAQLGVVDVGYALAEDELLSRYAHRIQARIAF
jgi:hypothetical protein